MEWGDQMDVLIIGSGGREHALAWKITQSPKVDKIYCAPGNGGTATIAENVNIKADDIPALFECAKEHQIGLTVVGPEKPLVMGITDKFQKNGLTVFGPSAKAARIEGSKKFCKTIYLSIYNYKLSSFISSK